MESWLARGASVVLASLIGYGVSQQKDPLKDFTTNPTQFMLPTISPLLTKALEAGKSTAPTEMNVNHTFTPIKITMRKKKSAKARGRRAEEDYIIVIVQEKEVSEKEGKKTEKTKKAAAGAEGGKARKKEGVADEKAVADEKGAAEGGKPNVAR